MKNTLLFLGDSFLPKPYRLSINFDCPFILNLEAPITKRNNPTPGKINLKTESCYLKEIFHKNPLAVSLSNNHMLDYGDEGFEDTIEGLKSEGISFFGAGTIEQNYNNPLVLNIFGKKIALFGYCYEKHLKEIENEKFRNTPAPLNIIKIKEDIKNHAGKFDSIVMQFHWGNEESSIPEPAQVLLARETIELGVDIIIGHHAHAIQPVERYKNGLIAYGLGNLIFDDLAVPCNYVNNNNTSALGTYFKKQRPWNRCSLGVFYDFYNASHDIMFLCFDGSDLYQKKMHSHCYYNYVIPNNFKTLEAALKKHKLNRQILSMIYRYMDKPRIPKLKGIMNLIKTVANYSKRV